jgi:TolB-like protein
MATGGKSLWRRVRENATARWTLAYVATAWILLQVVTQLAQIFQWPTGIARVAAIVLAAATPLVATTVWLREVRAAPRSRLVGGLLVGASAAGVLAAAWMVVHGPALSMPAASDGVPVLAVLPITDLRNGAPQDNLAESLRETMLDRLSREPAFKLASRTTTGAVRTKASTVPEIAKTLGATHVIEASITDGEDGAKVFTAQLIAADDTHVFSHEQAYASTTSVGDAKVQFTTDVTARTRFMFAADDWDSGFGTVDRAGTTWRAYKRAMMIARYQAPKYAVEELRRLVNADPGFARAHAMIVVLLPEVWDTPREDKLREADEAIAKAEALEPGLPETALARYVRSLWLTEADDSKLLDEIEPTLDKTLPNNVFTWVYRGWRSRNGGRWADAYAAFERAIRIDGDYQWPAANYAMLGIWLRKYDRAASYLSDMNGRYPRTMGYRIWYEHARFVRNGDTQVLASGIDDVIASFPRLKDGEWERGARMQLAAYEGRFADAAAIAEVYGNKPIQGFGFSSYSGRWNDASELKLEMLDLLGRTK